MLQDVRRFRKEVRTRRAKLQTDRATTGAGRRRARERSKSSIEATARRAAAAVRVRQGRDRCAWRLPSARGRRELERQARARLEAAAAACLGAPADARLSAGPRTDYPADGTSSTSPSAPCRRPRSTAGVVGIAMQYLGTPYVWGGSSPSGFDCSGFVMYVYAQVGISLPHNAAMQYNTVGVPVSQAELQPGDLVFFDGLGHVGIYIGGGQFIHAPHTGDVVKISSLYDSWYASTYVGAKRVT